MTLPPYQQRLLAFMARRKGLDDRVVMVNRKLLWTSELPPSKPASTGPLRGYHADVVIVDDPIP